jgi:hypothetical protein
MQRFARLALIIAAVVLSGLFSTGDPSPAVAQSIPPATGATAPQGAPQGGSLLLTIFLRHDQTKTLGQINEHLKQTGWYDKFPPEGVEIVSWYVMMGVGQVVTLRVPTEKLRDVNRVIEQSAWGGYHTEFYPTYDYKPVWDAIPHGRP